MTLYRRQHPARAHDDPHYAEGMAHLQGRRVGGGGSRVSRRWRAIPDEPDVRRRWIRRASRPGSTPGRRSGPSAVRFALAALVSGRPGGRGGARVARRARRPDAGPQVMPARAPRHNCSGQIAGSCCGARNASGGWKLDEAEEAFREVRSLTPDNAEAAAGLKQVAEDAQAEGAVRRGG